MDEIEAARKVNVTELGESFLQEFCKKAATSFFNDYGLISHQLNSFNFFIEHGIQKVFEFCKCCGRAGFSKWGNEKVYNGRTGETMQSLIFMGPTFYQRLVHMAEDKVKFRNTGPVHPLTRQPVADRKRFGGIKFGEMERDCLIAHGASCNLHERLFTLSDSSQMHVCRKCQNAANVIERTASNGEKIRGPYCRLCQSTDDVVRVYVPYGAKLLGQELFSMGITLKFDTKLC